MSCLHQMYLLLLLLQFNWTKNQCLPLHFSYPSIPQFTTSPLSAVAQLAQVDTCQHEKSLELSSGVTEPVGTPNEHCCLLKSAKPENLCKYRRIYRPIKFLTKSAMLLWKLSKEQCYRNHMKKKKKPVFMIEGASMSRHHGNYITTVIRQYMGWKLVRQFWNIIWISL